MADRDRRGQGPPGFQGEEAPFTAPAEAPTQTASGIAERFVGAGRRMVLIESPEDHQQNNGAPPQKKPAIGASA